MNVFSNLSVIRKLVQLAAFVFLVYGSVVVGFYTADKISGAFPALACAYDKQTADYCALIPFQHGMAHRVGETVTQGGDVWMGLLAVGTTLVTFLLLFVLLNKAFCGWICPLGFFQEAVTLVGQKLGLQRRESLPRSQVLWLRPVKWAMLAVLVFGLPLLSGLGFLGHEFVGSFCAVCPSRIVTTLATGDSSQLYFDTTTPALMVFSLVGDFLFGLMIALALTIRQPFCRICPMLALHAIFTRLGFARLVKQGTPRCAKCNLCAKACPMDIEEVATEMHKRDVTFPDCTLCGRCVEFCPDKGVLQLKYLGLRVFRADPAYFKQRKKVQQQWEKTTLSGWWRKRRQAVEAKGA